MRARFFKKKEKYSDVAIDASLRAAAIENACENLEKKGKFILTQWNLRKKVRYKQNASFIIFVLDSSDSMSIRSQMGIAKGVIISLLTGIYRREDRVALITFRDQHATIILNPTKSISIARERLRKLPTGGTTPFAHGILKAYQLIKGEKTKNPHVVPILIIASDGDANVPVKPMRDCMEEIKILGTTLLKEKIAIISIDTKPRGQGYQQDNEMKKISTFLGAVYLHIDEIGVRKIVEKIREIE